MNNLKPKHFILMGTAVLQLILLIVFLVGLFNGSTVRSYLEKGKYEKAVTLINKFDKLSADEKITDEIKTIIFDAESGFLSGSTAFGKAEATIQKFADIKNDSLQKMVTDASSCINAINSGDNAMSEQKYDKALEYYGALPEDDADIAKLKEEKFRSVSDAMSDGLVKLAKDGKYPEIMNAIEKLKEETKDDSLLDKIKGWEQQYLSEWLEKQRAEHIYVGENGAFELADKLASVGGDKALSGDIDSEFQSYLMTGVGNQKYDNVLGILEPNFEEIKKYCSPESVSAYNDIRITCTTALFNTAHEAGEYTGENGAFALADKLNSYKEGSVDKTALVNELAAKERYALIDKINATRKASGLSELLSNGDLENSAFAMLSKVNGGTYEDNDLYDVLSANNVKYSKACCAWNDDAATAEEVFSKFTPIEDFGILTEPELTRIGVGMQFDENSQKFAWFIIEILTE